VNTNSARLLFDECLGRPAVDLLKQLVAMGGGDKPVLSHILEFAPSGTRDESWIPRLAPEGWTVITSDGGRKPNKKRGEKLPRLCARYAVTHILISPYIHNLTSFEKLLSILSVWYPVLEIASDPARLGTRHLLEPVPSRARGQGRLIERPIPQDLIAIRDEYLKNAAETLPTEKSDDEDVGG
jgi:hypothetical protein